MTEVLETEKLKQIIDKIETIEQDTQDIVFYLPHG